jgi:hypothetical protein
MPKADRPVDPVGNVECTVGTKCGKVVGIDGLSLSGSLKHEQLREDGNSFKENGEGPKNLHDREAVVENEGGEERGTKKVFDFEGVDGWVIRGSVKGIRWANRNVNME